MPRFVTRAVIKEMVHRLNMSFSTRAGKVFRNVETFVVSSTEAMVRSNPHKSRAKTAIVEKFLVKRFDL